MVTNYHVVRDASDLQVTLQGGKECHAKVVGFDADKDIAVLQIDSESEVRFGLYMNLYTSACPAG